MSIEFRCIRCGQLLRVRNEKATLARCPNCDAVLDVPTRGQSPAILDGTKSDVIDYELFGDSTQYVEITLDPGEVVGARLDSLLHMAPGITTAAATTGEVEFDGGFLESLLQLGRRILPDTGRSMTAFCNVSDNREKVAFAPKTSGQLKPLHMDELGRQIFCHTESILCFARGIKLQDAKDTHFQDGLEVSGDGVVVLQAKGQLIHKMLSEHTPINIRTSSVIALTSEVQITPAADFGHEQIDVSAVSGPGEIWLQSS